MTRIEQAELIILLQADRYYNLRTCPSNQSHNARTLVVLNFNAINIVFNQFISVLLSQPRGQQTLPCQYYWHSSESYLPQVATSPRDGDDTRCRDQTISNWSERSACAALGRCCGTKCLLYLVLFFFISSFFLRHILFSWKGLS